MSMPCCRTELRLALAALLLAASAGARAGDQAPLELQLSPRLTPAAAVPASARQGTTDNDQKDDAGKKDKTQQQQQAKSASEAEERKSVFSNLYRAVDEFALVEASPRLSFHKPSYVMPASYSARYEKEETEFIFQLSLKLQLFKLPLYFGYTQRSYWQIYNADDSRPFRETNYNPELFYRWQPQTAFCPGCGLDVGAEHESNGRETADSRSWNRGYLSLYRVSSRNLIHLKTWYRIPEDRKTSADDPEGDDNPDIQRYLGHGELRIQHMLFDDHVAALMLRGNTRTGHGAVEFVYSAPFGDYVYWNLYYFKGYGESLIDYNHEVERIGLGLMLVR